MDEAFEEIKRVESSRGTEPEDFEKLLDAFHIATQRLNLTPELAHNHVTGTALERGYTKARDAIRGYVSRLQHDGEICAKDLSDAWEEIRSLRSQLSRIQQTGLTEND